MAQQAEALATKPADLSETPQDPHGRRKWTAPYKFFSGLGVYKDYSVYTVTHGEANCPRVTSSQPNTTSLWHSLTIYIYNYRSQEGRSVGKYDDPNAIPQHPHQMPDIRVRTCKSNLREVGIWSSLSGLNGQPVYLNSWDSGSRRESFSKIRCRQ